MSYEVRYRRKGTKTWHHDRIKGKKNVYYKGTKKYGGGYVTQKKDAHRTFKTRVESDEREKKLRKKLGSGYEFTRKIWG